MRFLLFPLLLLYAFSVAAQSDAKTINGWEVSLSFAPRFDRSIQLISAQVEIDDPINVVIDRRRFIDTLDVNGTTRFFNRTPSRGIQAKATDTDFWFGGQLTLHRRFGQGFDLGIGLYYSRAGYNSRTNETIDEIPGIVNTRGAVLYAVADVKERQLGLNGTFNYHLFPEKRLHPYFGIGINALLDREQINLLARAYTGDPEVSLPWPGINPQLSGTSLDVDFMTTAGILCRVADRWSVGVDFTSRATYGCGLFGLQLRYGG